MAGAQGQPALARWWFRDGHVAQFGPIRHVVESSGKAAVFVPEKATEEETALLFPLMCCVLIRR